METWFLMWYLRKRQEEYRASLDKRLREALDPAIAWHKVKKDPDRIYDNITSHQKESG